MYEVSEGEFQRLYGRWEPLVPREVASLFEGAPFRWWIAGGWAAEASGAPRRPHADTDVVVLYEDLAAVRSWLSDFHLWEAHAGSLRPLLAGDELKAGRQGLWVRRDAESPWVCDLLLTRSQDGRWLFKRAPQCTRVSASAGRCRTFGFTLTLRELSVSQPASSARVASAKLEAAYIEVVVAAERHLRTVDQTFTAQDECRRC